MKKIKIFAAAIIAVLFLSGCTAEDTVPPSETDAVPRRTRRVCRRMLFRKRMKKPKRGSAGLQN